jgi:ribonucleoside-diphosphate reductase alpha chain
MAERDRLPNRRNSELFDFDHQGRRWTATIGRFADGRVAEIFIDAAKGSPLAEMARDSALIASIALQSGCDFQALKHALVGRHAGPLGAALALVEGGGS